MRDKTSMQSFIKISGIVIKAIAIVFIGFFFMFTFLQGGHQETLHFELPDVFLFLFIPVLYLIGTFVSFKNEFVSGAIIFLSYVGYNGVILIVEQSGIENLHYSFLLIPSVLFILLYIVRKYEEARKNEFNALYGDYESLSQMYKIVDSMHQITTEILQENDLELIFQIILEKAIDIVPKAQTGSILIKNGDKMEFKAAVGYNLETLQNVNLLFDDMYQSKLGNIYEPTVIRDIRTFNGSNLSETKMKNLDEQDALIAKAVLTCAITFKDEIYGFINLDNIEDTEAFKESDKAVIKQLAQQIEIAVKNQKLVDDIYKLSRYDALTGAYTRTYHTTLLKEIFEEARKNRAVFSICNLDINELKPINDKYGHDAGDDYIVYFSDVIKDHLKPEDMFSRMGGDEFIVVYASCDKECAEENMEEIRDYFIKHPFKKGKTIVPLTFGCGISTFIDDSEDLEKLLVLADQKMYANKRHRK